MYLGSTSIRRIHPHFQFIDRVSIDVVIVKWERADPNEWVYYTQDGKALYCVIYDKSCWHIELLKFNLETWLHHRFKKVTGVDSVSFVRLAEWTVENKVAIVIDFQKISGSLRILCQSEPERRIRGYKSSGASLKFPRRFAD